MCEPSNTHDATNYLSSPKNLHRGQSDATSSLHDNHIDSDNPNTSAYTPAHQNCITSRQSKWRYRYAQQSQATFVNQGTHATSARSSTKGN